MANVGPVKLEVVGDEYTLGCRILAIIWEGSGTAGDTAVVEDRGGNGELWKGRAVNANIYCGANFPSEGVHAPNGFKLSQLSSGTVSVYLREN